MLGLHKTVFSVRSLLTRIRVKGSLPMRGCLRQLALGCLIFVLTIIACSYLVFRAVGVQ